MGFLQRKPDKIRANQLHDGGFLLPKNLRETVQEQIKSGKNGILKLKNGNTAFEVYINQQKQPGEAFVLGPQLGKGAFGEVFIAQNVTTGQWSCMKKLTNGAVDPIELDILKKEGMYRSNPKTDDNDVFLLELIHGKGLDKLVDENSQDKSLSFEQTLAIIQSLLEAYESLQSKGYVHRDIKPANVMIDMSQLKCFAIDFGLVSAANQLAETFGGSPYYMPPEAIQSKFANNYQPKFSDDIYAIGLTAAELLASTMYSVNPDAIQNSTVPSVSERNAYGKQINENFQHLRKNDPDFPKIGDMVNRGIAPVILAAEDPRHQKLEKLSDGKIYLSKLIFSMTGKSEKRPTLEVCLAWIRSIRIAHIQEMSDRLEGPYRAELNALLALRNKLKSAGPMTVDNIDAFMLRMVDEKPENRPSLETVQAYKNTFSETIASKAKITGESLEKAKEKLIKPTESKIKKGLTDEDKQYFILGSSLKRIELLQKKGFAGTLSNSEKESLLQAFKHLNDLKKDKVPGIEAIVMAKAKQNWAELGKNTHKSSAISATDARLINEIVYLGNKAINERDPWDKNDRDRFRALGDLNSPNVHAEVRAVFNTLVSTTSLIPENTVATEKEPAPLEPKPQPTQKKGLQATQKASLILSSHTPSTMGTTKALSVLEKLGEKESNRDIIGSNGREQLITALKSLVSTFANETLPEQEKSKNFQAILKTLREPGVSQVLIRCQEKTPGLVLRSHEREALQIKDLVGSLPIEVQQVINNPKFDPGKKLNPT